MMTSPLVHTKPGARRLPCPWRARSTWCQRLALGAVLSSSAAGSIAATAAPLDLTTLVQRADRILRGKSSAAVLHMDVKTQSYERTYKMVLWDDSSGGTDKTLVKILGPASWRGYSTLKVGNQLEFFDPKTNHVQVVGNSMLGDSWMGSHFSNDDLVKETSLSAHYTASLIESHTANNERGEPVQYYRINLVPKPTAPVVWARIEFELWQRGNVVLPVQSQYFSKPADTRPARTLHFSDVQNMDGRLVPAQVEVTVASKPNEYTRLTYDKLRFDIEIPTDKFTEQAMR